MYATSLFDPLQLSLISPISLIASPTPVNPPHFPITEANGESTPITVAECFRSLAQATEQRMRAQPATQLVVPHAFAERTSLNTKFVLCAQAWRFESRLGEAELRLVKIDGAKSNIINAWIFPADPRRCPVYAAELIGVGENVRVAFIDIQAPLRSAASAELHMQVQSVAGKFKQLPCDEAAPDWAIDASLGHYTYARQVPASQLAQIHTAYLAYLDTYLNHVNRPVPAVSHQVELQAGVQQLTAYQLHHMHHSPGQKFLGNLFGIQWTEQFMLDFLFAQL